MFDHMFASISGHRVIGILSSLLSEETDERGLFWKRRATSAALE